MPGKWGKSREIFTKKLNFSEKLIEKREKGGYNYLAIVKKRN